MACGCGCGLSRRRFLALGAAALALPLAGCDESGDWPIDLVSDETVTRMGLESWNRLREEVPPSDDPALQAALRRVGERLLRASGREPGDWEMRVFAGDDINAFALPGGKIGVFEGMMRFAGNEAQLAAVVGHEIGHTLADHSQERMNAAVLKDLGINVVEFLLNLNEVQFSREIAAVLGMGAEVGLALPYSRGHELEADRIGVDLMRPAGYDPREAVTLWRRMAQRMAREGGQPFAFLSTHPAPADRAERLEAVIAAQ